MLAETCNPEASGGDILIESGYYRRRRGRCVCMRAFVFRRRLASSSKAKNELSVRYGTQGAKACPNANMSAPTTPGCRFLQICRPPTPLGCRFLPTCRLRRPKTAESGVRKKTCVVVTQRLKNFKLVKMWNNCFERSL